ncbi:lipopolysaccharide biosynthesis protein [Sinorhizobium meliloti]|uniref:lipopolysaccharide biosynthesis protein n=1 Tax=Rhizobium meliloti TaxID=382 RepID=UPI0003034CF1|nr:lipopolysaccharide biosynthesis protein [Sinorhizobium meliloti]MDE3764232.1 lipopolysaccharide biosynthesis protein [Sinorhizobium meliloti]MDE3777999.1 lipopolysaccharide biosynthesis protein [Sinorhizobium meliloti]MDE3802182.1 lipopolysaccharide biosynthesis protein [Sinorhizobium meliloti]MDE4552041.1 lipopolysaccharide biosynthesis protein [Sinorhizobium meliloti]RVG87822.1 lipopolysaccharide biosynthesis protein [Sinorhizobium meliloti]
MAPEGVTEQRGDRPFLPMVVSYLASGGSLVLGSAAQLLTFAILARWLGVHEFSVFVAITAVANIAVHLCGLGAMECLVRRVARDRAIYPQMLGHNVILTAASGAALVLLGAVVLPFFFTLSPDPVTNVAVITLMLVTNILLVRVIVLTEQIYIAHTDFASANKVVVGFAAARTVAAALACIAFGVTSVAYWAVWQFLCHVLVALLCMRAIRGLGTPRYRIVREEIPQGLYFSIPFILRALRQNADLLVLSLVTTAEVVASYSVARRMLESSYLSVEALNRLIYPGSARATAAGLHQALQRVRRVLAAATVISLAAAVTVFVLAPVLPYLFGKDYLSLVGFVRILCWVVVPLAMWSVAVEALGASGAHAARATVMGLGSIAGAGLAVWASWYAPPMGTFLSFYAIEIAMVVASWSVLLHFVRRHRRQAALTFGAGVI